MTGGVLALRYATALIDLAREENNLEEAGLQLAVLAKACEDSNLRKVLLDPSCSIDDKLKIIEAVSKKLKLNKTLENFSKVLVENKRTALLGSINESFQELYDGIMGRVKTELIVPFKPTSEEEDEIRNGLEKSTGKKVVINVKVDPELIGGVIARVGNTIYDGSLRTQLRNIKNNIMRG